jgi:hypothetical protein
LRIEPFDGANGHDVPPSHLLKGYSSRAVVSLPRGGGTLAVARMRTATRRIYFHLLQIYPIQRILPC